MTKPHIQIILCSTRDQRRGPPIARWFAAIAAEREDITSELLGLAEFDLPFLSGATPPMTADSRDEAARGWGANVADGDGYVFVVPEYNDGYPAAVKNALDHLFGEWSRKPIGFVSYAGLAGGVRAVEQLRQVAVELECRSAAKWRSRGSSRQSTSKAICAHPFPYKRPSGWETTSELGRPPSATAAPQSQPQPHHERGRGGSPDVPGRPIARAKIWRAVGSPARPRSQSGGRGWSSKP
jgi:NAD(P)H-dependent FMN reductase